MIPIAVKTASEILLTGVPVAGPLIGAISELRKEYISRTQEAMRLESQDRLDDFYKELLTVDKKMDEQAAKALMIDKDFHALLRACVTDIESEKSKVYANLARGIATGAVLKEWRRHFILSLQELSAQELECLRGALIALKNNLIPTRGPLMGQDHFLTVKPRQEATPKAVWISNLVSRGLVEDGKLTQVGEAFTRACFHAEELTPSSMGYRAWSNISASIISYEISTPVVDKLSEAIQFSFRNDCIKSNIFAVTRSNSSRMNTINTMAVLLVKNRLQFIEENMPHLVAFAQKVHVILVDIDNNAGEFPDIKFFARVDASKLSISEILAEVRQHAINLSYKVNTRPNK